MSVPCTGCICKPICKQKSFAQLYRECSTITEFTNLNKAADPVSLQRLSDVDEALDRHPKKRYFYGGPKGSLSFYKKVYNLE